MKKESWERNSMKAKEETFFKTVGVAIGSGYT